MFCKLQAKVMHTKLAEKSTLSLTEAPKTTNKVCSPVFCVITAELSSIPENKIVKITGRSVRASLACSPGPGNPCNRVYEIQCYKSGGAGSPSHNALRINYIISRRWSRDLLVVSGVHGVEFTVS